jgi:hypothetical protein
MNVFWDVTPCKQVQIHRRFEGRCASTIWAYQPLGLKMQAAHSSETSVNIYQTTRRDVPEYCIIRKFRGQQRRL